MQFLIAGLIGVVSGITSGLFGVGGGLVMVPAMIYFLKMDIKLAVGTSLLVIIPTAFSGAYKHYTLGNVSWKIALMLIPTAMIASVYGAHLTSVLSSAQLKRIFGGVLIFAGARLLMGK